MASKGYEDYAIELRDMIWDKFTRNYSEPLSKYLEMELACPLEVIFKAREGFYTYVGYISPEHIYNIDIKNQTIEFEWLEDGCWNEDGLVEFENYKSNWWLKEDRSE